MIPSEISLLTHLRNVVIQEGELTEIPPGILDLEDLINLDLDKNNITGSFPFSNSANMDELLRLDINYNSLTGSLDFVNMFPNLKEAHLDNNAFVGTIPESVGQLDNLRKCVYVYVCFVTCSSETYFFLVCMKS